MAAFQLYQRVQLTRFHPRYTHTHTHRVRGPFSKVLISFVYLSSVCRLAVLYALSAASAAHRH